MGRELMCGRFTYKLAWSELVNLYRLTRDNPARNTQARYNVCPTTSIDLVVSRDGQRSCIPMRWGLIPAWWNKPLKEMKLATFNARADTVALKPMFRSAFKRNRCLTPVSGYYEWQDTPEGKQPCYFTHRDEWQDRASGERIISATMIITEANASSARCISHAGDIKRRRFRTLAELSSRDRSIEAGGK